MYPLCLLEPPDTRKEGLESVGVFLDGPRAAAFGELEQGGRRSAVAAQNADATTP